jgi:hypothetical protein
MHMLLAEIWDLNFVTRHRIVSTQLRNIPSEILHQMLSSAKENPDTRSYCNENNEFRNVVMPLLVPKGKFVKRPSVPAKWQTAQFIHIYIYIYIYI